MAAENPFVLPKDQYVRDLNVLRDYVVDSATLLSKVTKRPMDECLAYVRDAIRPGGQFEFKDPEVYYLERPENGDRVQQTGTLSAYLNESIKQRELISPTLTTYANPAVQKSLLVDFIDTNVKARGVAKKAMFRAKMARDKPTETIKKIEQTLKKLSNNALSGAHVSASTPLYNKTAHSTLTSNCRTTSGYGNANNEKFLCGNRHYWSAEIVINNIISIINHSDYPAIQAVMRQFEIRHPTVMETMECIQYSTHHYWRNKDMLEKIYRLVSSLSPIERSAFVYTGDMYHLRKFNDSVVRQFVSKLSARVEGVHPDPEALLSSTPEEYHNLAKQICEQEMRGRVLQKNETTGKHQVVYTDEKKVPLTPEESERCLMVVCCTIQNIIDTIQGYGPLIRAFWATPNVPASVAYFPDSIRHAAVTSDTDSTIFTVQDWVCWHQGRVGFDQSCNSVGAVMIFLASQAIVHVLARMSANFGIEEKRLFQIAMKNEFYFPVFVPTQVAKHYYALISVQEGNVFEDYDQEIKGVHLKSSNAPKVIMKAAKNMMESIMLSVVQEKPISIKEVLKQIADIERGVKASIARGSHEYFRLGQIKSPESYAKLPEESPYSYYLMWEEVFAPKYGNAPPPPYTSVKVSTILDTPTKTRQWLAAMKDRELAARMEAWMMKYKKKVLPITTFHLPEQCISSVGIPEEILEIVGVRKIVLDTTKVFYLILETLGEYMLNDNMSRLVSDYY